MTKHQPQKVSQKSVFEGILSVLIVEDDDDLSFMLREKAEGKGIFVKVADSRQEAFEIFTRYHFDLVLLDIKLGDEDGLELIPEFREKKPDIVIVTMTGDNPRETEIRARNNKVAYHLIKPFSFWELKIIFKHIAINKTIRKARGTSIERDVV